MLLPYFLIFLFPLGVYLLVLATINRRERPLMIAGVWDSLMLSAGLSGIFLWVGPALLGAFYERGYLPGEQTNRQFEEIWRLYPIVWGSYYGLVLCGQTLMVLSRKNKTVVYNVDAGALENLLARALADKGFRITQQHGLFVFEKKAEGIFEKRLGGSVPNSVESGAVDVEAFLPLRNVTLNWHADDRLRRAIEADIATRLADAVTADNPSVPWLLGVSGVIFGLVFLGALLVILAGIVIRV